MDVNNEQLLIKKQYYQSFVKSEDVLESIRVLSSQLNHSLMTAAGKIDEIRFAQAELYLLLEDYETAIYKWESVKNVDLSGWALKNMGDAYRELGMFEKAESSYLSVYLPPTSLKMENLLSLYYLYIKVNQMKKAHGIVDELVFTDFSYKHVVELALQFYEQIEEYLSAVTLVINRLEVDYDVIFISRLYTYLDKSRDNQIPPSSTISRLLVLLWTVDKSVFDSLFQALNSYYIGSPYFLDWFDCLFEAFEKTNNQLGKSLLDEHALTFYHLTDLLLSGDYSTSKIKNIIENQVPIYYSICQESPLKSSLGALLKAWEEDHPNSISKTFLENMKFTSGKIYEIENMEDYYSNVKQWMTNLEFDYDLLSSWWLDYWLVDANKKVMIAGNFSNGKSSFINSILKEDVLCADHLPTTSAVTIIQYGESSQLLELNHSSIERVLLDNLQSKTTINHDHSSALSNSLISFQFSNKSLQENQITLIDTPGFNDEGNQYNPTYDFLYLADELLLILSSEAPYTKEEKKILLKIIEKQPDLPIRFILNKADYLDEDEREEIIEDIERKLLKHLNQDIVIMPYSSLYPDETEQRSLNDYFCKLDRSLYQRRIYKAIPYFNQFLTQFPNFLQAKEQNINNLVLLKKKEVDGLKELKQRFNQYKNKNISQAAQLYVSNVVTSIYNKVKEQTLNGLRQFSNRIDVNTNLNNVHLLLDQEMNNWLEANLTQIIIPLIYNQFREWLQNNFKFLDSVEIEIDRFQLEVEDIINSSRERTISLKKETFIEEMKKYFQETVATIQYKQLDILKKVNPLQNILSGVGRLLGGKSHSASLKIDQYRQYLETKSYEEATSQYLFNITKTLGNFEKIIRDEFDHLFQEFEGYIDHEIQSSSQEMIKHAQALKNLYNEKDTYFETIKIFKLKIRQIEIDYAEVHVPLKITQ